MDATARQALTPRIRQLAEPVAARHACDLVAVELTNEGGQEIIRVFIDAPGGVTVGDCTKVSRAMSVTLDVEDPMPDESYRLEVSSPGIDRPVQTRDDMLRFTGFRARIKLTPRKSRRRFTGVLAGLDGDTLLLSTDGHETPRTFPLEDVARIRLVLDPDEFERLGKEGLPPLPSTSSPTPDPTSAGAAPEGDPDDQ